MEKDHDAWNGQLYGRNSAHHRRYDDAFLAALPLRPTDEVLDIGCGTGDFTVKLSARVPQGRVVGLDASPSQITAAAVHARSNLGFVVGRAEALDINLADRRFDAIESRATLHWLPEDQHPALLRTFRRHLHPGGVLRVEMGGAGQIAAVRAILDEVSSALGGPRSPWFFPEPASYRATLEEAGFDVHHQGFVRLIEQRRSMPARDDLLGFLRSQVFLAYETHLTPAQRHQLRSRAEARADELRRPDGSYDLDFVRLDVLAHAPG
jgi:trans-aconitate 2-methyltransferase